MAVTVVFNPSDAKMFAAFAKQEARLKDLERGYSKVGAKAQRAGKQSREAFGGRATSNLKSYVVSLVSASAAIATASKGYEAWLKNIREFGTEARKASDEMIAFAALQEGGTKAKRVMRAARLGVQFGISDRGAAFNAVQALQSALGGDFEAGMKAAATVFAATLVKIPLGRALETEIVGIAQGQGPGNAVRRAFVAGEASARSPEVLASAGPGLQFFKDKEVGFAAAGVLASEFAGRLETFVSAAGFALSTVSAPDFQKTLQRLGVAKGTQLEKIVALRGAGIDTVEKLSVAGLTEKRQRQALAGVIQGLPELLRIRGEIQRLAVPGILLRKRTAIEAELPQARFARQIAVGEAAQAHAQAFGPRALGALEEDRRALIRGRALRSMGAEGGFPLGDLIDETGRTSPFQFFRARLGMATPFTTGPGLRSALARAAAEVGAEDFTPAQPTSLIFPNRERSDRAFTASVERQMEAIQALENAAQNLAAAAESIGGGTTLARPDDDR